MDSKRFVTPQEAKITTSVLDYQWMEFKKSHLKLSFSDSCNKSAEDALAHVKLLNRLVFRKLSYWNTMTTIYNFLNDFLTHNSQQFFCNYITNLVCNGVNQKCECPKGLLWDKKRHICSLDVKRNAEFVNVTSKAYIEYKKQRHTFNYLDFNDACDFLPDNAYFGLVQHYEHYENKVHSKDSDDKKTALNHLYKAIQHMWSLHLTEKLMTCNLDQGLKCSLTKKRCICSTDEKDHKFIRINDKCYISEGSLCVPPLTYKTPYPVDYTIVKYLPAATRCEWGTDCTTESFSRRPCFNFRIPPNSTTTDVKNKLCRCMEDVPIMFQFLHS